MTPNSGTTPVLALNGGSSSLKFALYCCGEAPNETLLARGEAENIGLPDGRLWVRLPSQTSGGQAQARPSADDPPQNDSRPLPDHEIAIRRVFDALAGHGLPPPAAVGHRIVNGGPDHFEPQRITPELVSNFANLIPLAPLHLPTELKLIAAVTAQSPGVPQVACFDTAFHRRMPEVAQRFPLPRSLWNEGLRRYGFHGLSYEYVLQMLTSEVGPSAKSAHMIIAHLGNGASLAAIRDGQSVDTTMGFSPTGGVMMGTRTGDLDPGAFLYVMREKGYDIAKLEDLVDRESGLLGVSGLTSDMKVLLQQRDQAPQARMAVEMFCYSVRKHIGALAAVLDGCDSLVFTGGIGEHAAPVRDDICRGLSHLGIRLDAEKNNVHAGIISAAGAACTVRVIATNEELMIARHTRNVVSAPHGKAAVDM